jgi:hypothetical protein
MVLRPLAFARVQVDLAKTVVAVGDKGVHAEPGG